MIVTKRKGRHMAKDEMETIAEDRWDEDVWDIIPGIGEDQDLLGKRSTRVLPRPKLTFYFGEKVALRTMPGKRSPVIPR